MRFDGRTILVTGGSGAMGALIAGGMRKEGGEVIVLDRVAPADGGAHILADLSSAEGLEQAAAAVAGTRPDILVNLAGIQHFGPFESQSPEHLLASYMVNLVAPARLAQAVLPEMKARRRGQIVNVGSIFGSINFAHFASYSSAKAGLRGLSQALRRELAGTGVGVTYVAPRAVRTPLNSPAVMRLAAATGMRFDEPDAVARRIVDCIRSDVRDAYFGFPESLFVRINALAPSLVDGALAANDRKAAALFTASPQS